jgi:CRP-like cAMP-binding protein
MASVTAGMSATRGKTKPAATALPFDAQSFLASVGEGRSTVKFPRAETVFRQGDPADAVFYIQKGEIRLTVTSKQGKQAVIATLEEGHFFGEGCLAGQNLHMASAIATVESVCVRIEKATMIRVLHDQPSLTEMFLAYLLHRTVDIEADLVDQLFNSSEQRLARVLLLLAHFAKEGKMQPVLPNISQDVLAARVGTTRSRINFFMNKFRKLGFIEYNGRGSLKVHTSLLNVVVHD